MGIRISSPFARVSSRACRGASAAVTRSVGTPVPLDMGSIVAFEVEPSIRRAHIAAAGCLAPPRALLSGPRRPLRPGRDGVRLMTIAILGIFFIVAMGAGLYVAGKVPGTASWVLGGVSGFLGLAGLFVAARSGPQAPVGYYGGIVFFLV